MKTSQWIRAGGRGAACSLLLAFTLLGASASAQADGRVKVSSAADLPVHTYAVTSKVRPLAEDPEVVSALAAAVSADITADLARYDIADRATLRGLYGTLLDAAFLRKDFAAARRDIKAVQGLEDKPADRATSGLLGGALLDALQSPGTDFHKTLRADIKRAYGTAPHGFVRDDLKQQSQALEVFSRDVVVAASAGGADTGRQRHGSYQPGSHADDLLTEAFFLRYILPNKADLTAAYSAVLDAPGGMSQSQTSGRRAT